MKSFARRFPFASTSSLQSVTLIFAVLCALTIMSMQGAQAQTLTVLHSFTGGSDGSLPEGALAMGGTGIIYGTTYQGGGSGQNNGTVFKLTGSGSSWIFTPIWEFTHGNDGAQPTGGITIGPHGVPYGTTTGGEGAGTDGTVFTLMPPLNSCKTALCYWDVNTIFPFSHGDGAAPQLENLTFDASGNVYGTTYGGGAYGGGVAFKLLPSSGGWTEKVMYLFGGGTDGVQPYGGILLDSAANAYTTTSYGGTSNMGTVIELSPNGLDWRETILYNFSDNEAGRYPETGLVMDAHGNIYGTTPAGGSGGGGTVFELTQSGGQWNLSVIYSFTGSGGPAGGTLTVDSAGNLWGVTVHDGVYDEGMVFKLSNSNGSWTLTDIYDFTGGTDGAAPLGGVLLAPDGNIFGTAASGGDPRYNCYHVGCGTVWEITQ